MAENVYSELACTACPAKSCRLGRSRELCRSVEPILYYGDNYEHRTGKAIHKRGPLGFLGYNRWPYFLFNLSACPCFCPCQSVSMKYSAAISKTNPLTLSILTRLSILLHRFFSLRQSSCYLCYIIRYCYCWM